jgi:carboxyl-terminal processing protease
MMSDSSGCKIAFLAILIAIITGGLGFAAGYTTHAIQVAVTATTAVTTNVQVTPTAAEAVEPTAMLAEPPSSPSPGATAGPTPAPTIEIPLPTGKPFDLFWEAWSLIQQDYYGDLPSEDEVVYGAIRGAINTLDDPFTGFLEPDIATIEREDQSGAFEGIGAYVTMSDGQLSIVSTFKDQPAEKAGLRRGDIVLKVDDTPIENMSIYEAISLIRGPAGTSVRLTILREGQESFEVEITRARIDIPVVESQLREDGIAYVSLYDFSSDASTKLADAIQGLLAQNPKGLILDLRGNPGGFLNEAVLTTGLFLPKDQVVVSERYKDAPPQVIQNPIEPVAPDIPMVILVDGGSASASEIVAGALQDDGRAVLVGEKTFGKGCVQLRYELSNGSELRVTIARWFTPNGRAIHGEGLEPDIAVAITQQDLDAELDPQLDRAVEYLLTGK